MITIFYTDSTYNTEIETEITNVPTIIKELTYWIGEEFKQNLGEDQEENQKKELKKYSSFIEELESAADVCEMQSVISSYLLNNWIDITIELEKNNSGKLLNTEIARESVFERMPFDTYYDGKWYRFTGYAVKLKSDKKWHDEYYCVDNDDDIKYL